MKTRRRDFFGMLSGLVAGAAALVKAGPPAAVASVVATPAPAPSPMPPCGMGDFIRQYPVTMTTTINFISMLVGPGPYTDGQRP